MSLERISMRAITADERASGTEGLLILLFYDGGYLQPSVFCRKIRAEALSDFLDGGALPGAELHLPYDGRACTCGAGPEVFDFVCERLVIDLFPLLDDVLLLLPRCQIAP